jgi:hypothetical protein
LTAVTLVCLVLLALLAVAQVAHTHSVDTDADHCPLCIGMHSAVPVIVAAALILLIQIERSVVVFQPLLVTRSWHPQLFTRPPPAF